MSCTWTLWGVHKLTSGCVRLTRATWTVVSMVFIGIITPHHSSLLPPVSFVAQIITVLLMFALSRGFVQLNQFLFYVVLDPWVVVGLSIWHEQALSSALDMCVCTTCHIVLFIEVAMLFRSCSAPVVGIFSLNTVVATSSRQHGTA